MVNEGDLVETIEGVMNQVSNVIYRSLCDVDHMVYLS